MKKQHKQPKHINAKRNNKKLCENHFDEVQTENSVEELVAEEPATEEITDKI